MGALGGPLPCGCGRRPQHIHTPTLPAQFKCNPTVNVDLPKPNFVRTGQPGPSPGPVTDPGEYVVEQLLNRKTVRGRIYYLVL